MFSTRTKTWIWIATVFAVLLAVAIILNRANINPAPVPQGEIPEQTVDNTIVFTDAPEHVGQQHWVEGEVDHVFVSDNDNYFINFCPDFRDCPFSAVIFSESAEHFDDIESWGGEQIYIYGEISTYENRPQIIIEQTEQVEVIVTGVGERSGDGVLAEVMAVIDGDTIRVRLDGTTETVRLIGIDTPEIDGPHTEEECFGPEASRMTAELLEGEEVALLSDPYTANRDRFGRLLRYVFMDDGTHINALLVEEGYATFFPFELFVFQDHFSQLETRAQAANRGLWGACQ